MGYVVLKPIKVQRDGRQLVTLKPGEHVPEAAGWHNVESFVQRGKIAFVEDGEQPVAEAPKRTGGLGMKLEKKAAPVESSHDEHDEETAHHDKPKAKKKTKKKH